MSRRRADRRRAGFTLLEVMAAISIFLIGVVSVLALLAAGTRLHQESQTTLLAADAADELLLLAQREVAEAVPAGGRALPEAPPARPVPGRPELTWSWNVKPATEGELWLLTVEIGWKLGGKPRTQKVERVLSRLTTPAVDAASLWK